MENWKSVIGYLNFYEVSDLGRVRSKVRYGFDASGRRFKAGGRILKDRIGKNGRKAVALFREGNRSDVDVHRLVYQAFNGRLIKGMHIDHINNNPLDNRAINLQQVTPRFNRNKDQKRSINSPYSGVFRSPTKSERWCARIWKGKEVTHLGSFDTPEMAYQAYQNAISCLQ